MDQLLAALRAAGERSRLRLLALLRENELAVNELGRIVGQSQPRVSRHLKLLCEAGLLERFQEGAWVFYRMAESGPNAGLARTIVDLIPYDDPELLRDRERLQAVSLEKAGQAARYFSSIATRWDDLRRLHVGEAAVEQAVLEACGEGPIDDFLDLGTGTGRMLALFGHRIKRGLGLDLSREMLAVARNHLDQDGLRHCRVRQGNIYQVDIPPATMDVVVVHHVLHFLDRPMDAIVEAARTLRPGGRLLVVDFGPHNLEQLRTEHAHRRLGFTDSEIEGWFTAAGMTNLVARHLTASDSSRDKPLTAVVWSALRSAANVVPITRETRP